MDETKLIELLDKNYSIAKLSLHFGKGKSTIGYWLKKYNLKTNYNYRPPCKIIPTSKICNKCKIEKPIEDYYFKKDRNNYRSICKVCHNKQQNDTRIDRNNKQYAVNYKGGKCEICELVTDNMSVYDFHHKDPSKKEYSITNKKYNKLGTIKPELDKCHLLCANCHSEVHGGLHPDYLITYNNVETYDLSGKNKICKSCEINKPVSFYYKRSGKSVYYNDCKKCHNKRSSARLRTIKKQCVEYKGGKCEHCGYNKYLGSIDFHHRDPSEKKYGISNCTKSFEDQKGELDKCNCICKNCHRKEHS